MSEQLERQETESDQKDEDGDVEMTDKSSPKKPDPHSAPRADQMDIDEKAPSDEEKASDPAPSRLVEDKTQQIIGETLSSVKCASRIRPSPTPPPTYNRILKKI